MHRHPRSLIGLLLLVTMSVSLAETVWAAVCAPDMPGMAAASEAMPGMEGMAAMDDMPPTSDMPACPDCLPGQEHDPQQRGDGEPPCPFSPAGAAQGCVASAVLPGRVATLHSPSLSDAGSPPADDASPPLIRTASIFHPPKS